VAKCIIDTAGNTSAQARY